jgi:protein gp37
MIEDVDHWGKGAPRRKSLSAVKAALAMNRKPWICDVCGEARSDKDEDCQQCSLPDPIQGFRSPGVHRRRIFSLSLGDWLDDEVPIEWLADMLDTIRKCDQVTWILCSKRWENWESRLRGVCVHLQSLSNRGLIEDHTKHKAWQLCNQWLPWNGIHRFSPPANIIGLCSVENQKMALKRVPELIQTPLACRGLSLEPLLGPVDFILSKDSIPPISVLNTGSIEWLIIGGESGSGPAARPCNVEWIRSLVQQGQAAGVATFVKQLGQFPTAPQNKFWPEATFVHFCPEYNLVKLTDKKGGDPSEWSPDLRIQQWPKGF